jgi:hypothetical protein
MDEDGKRAFTLDVRGLAKRASVILVPIGNPSRFARPRTNIQDPSAFE